MMKNWILILLSSTLSLLISTSPLAETAEQLITEMEQLPVELRQFTSVTVKDPKFNPIRPTIVSWSESLRIYHDESTKLEPARVIQVEDELNSQLTRKGYQIAKDSKETRYYLQAMVALGNQAKQDSLGRIIGLSAGLGGHKIQLDMGSLALVIVDKNTQQMLWRSKVQIFTERSLPDNIRNERLRMAVTELLSELPTL